MQQIKFDDLPGWTFTIEEVSAGAYQASGIYTLGNQVGCQGNYFDALAQCKTMAKELSYGLKSDDK